MSDIKDFKSTYELPCGATGYWDGCRLRCTACFAIWGSVGCRCSNEIISLTGKGQ